MSMKSHTSKASSQAFGKVLDSEKNDVVQPC